MKLITFRRDGKSGMKQQGFLDEMIRVWGAKRLGIIFETKQLGANWQ